MRKEKQAYIILVNEKGRKKKGKVCDDDESVILDVGK
jgi:hypothetical protein